MAKTLIYPFGDTLNKKGTIILLFIESKQKLLQHTTKL